MMRGVTINSSVIVSLAAITVAAIGVVAAFGPAMGSLRLREGDTGEVRTSLEKAVALHDAQQERYADRFAGRSIFYRPPVRRPTPPPTREVEPPVLPPPTVESPPAVVVRPATYTGPGIRAFDGDRVWFANGLLLGEGEEAEGLRVLSVQAPWSAEVSYAGWTGPVTIFPRFDEATHFQSGVLAARRTPGIIDADASAASRVPGRRTTSTPPRTPTGRATAAPSRGSAQEGQDRPPDE